MSERAGISKTALLYAGGIFVSASLLFMVQPMVARMLLPRLGGTSAVWTTCMLFFQVLLLGGYLYAHILAKRLPPKPQLGLHLLLAASCAVFLPLSIRDGAPAADAMPIGWLLVTLLGAVGLPFFVLSTTSPLLQSWFSKTNDPLSHNPYPLYAASNVGSMTSLLGYPFLIEPMLTLKHQTWLWSGGFALFFAFLIACALVLAQRGGLTAAASQAETSDDSTDEPPPTTKKIARWIGLAFVPSSLLLGVTTHITTDVAPMPLLWIVPLALYLLSFILVFSNWTQAHQDKSTWMSWVILLPALLLLVLNPSSHGVASLLMYLGVFTGLTLVFHGQLSLERPAAKHLTLFFLCMSIGGAAGGLFNGLFAPLVFNRFMELHIVLLGASLWMILPLSALMERSPDMHKKLTIATLVSMSLLLNVCMNDQDKDWQLALAILVLSGLLARLLSLSLKRAWPAMALCLIFAQGAAWAMSDTIEVKRSFFSTHKVAVDPVKQLRLITHGGTIHGMQSSDPKLSQQALSYHHPSGPVGQAVRTLADGAGARYAVLGLGAGALAAYCRNGIVCDMFEIDPVVVDIAREHFTYLKDCGDAYCPVEIGDGRLLIEAKADATYDVIFQDAFNSDAVPAHLLTREALAIYLKKLKPNGVIIFNISNRYLDLRPVLAPLAKDANLHAIYQIYSPDDKAVSTFASASDWVIMARTPADLAPFTADPRWRPLIAQPGEPLWTDDYSNILPAISPGGATATRSDK